MTHQTVVQALTEMRGKWTDGKWTIKWWPLVDTSEEDDDGKGGTVTVDLRVRVYVDGDSVWPFDEMPVEVIGHVADLMRAFRDYRVEGRYTFYLPDALQPKEA